MRASSSEAESLIGPSSDAPHPIQMDIDENQDHHGPQIRASNFSPEQALIDGVRTGAAPNAQAPKLSVVSPTFPRWRKGLTLGDIE